MSMDVLPAPDPAALKLSTQLQDAIREAIKSSDSGNLSFAQFMEMALYEPGLGYYSAGSVKFGSQGDFVTAPEISPFFGQCLATQIAQVFSSLGENTLLEFGAGSGRLACDILLELESLDALPETYRILEVSADLRERQHALIRKELPHLIERVKWLDTLEGPLNGVILANEVLDAMPVERFQISGSCIMEQRVGFRNHHFCFEITEASDSLIKAVDNLDIDFPHHYVSEINRMLPAWFSSLCNILETGVIFCVDYGESRRDYYHPERNNGTLVCHYRHRVHDDPLVRIGLQDISASVDFTAVAEAAFACGLDVEGYTTQAAFLLSCGLTERLAEIKRKFPDQYLHYSRQAQMLTLPGEMGERFKVMALSKGFDEPLIGFAMNDMLEKL